MGSMWHRSLCLILLLASSASAQMVGSGDVVSAAATWSNDHAGPGDRRVLAVTLKIADGFHINPDAGQLPAEMKYLVPTTVELAEDLPDLTPEEPVFPPVDQIMVHFTGEASRISVFRSEVTIYLPVAIDARAGPGERSVAVKLRYQSCNDAICLRPTTVKLEAPLVIEEKSVPDAGLNAPLFAGLNRAGPHPPTIPIAVSDVHANDDLVRFDLFGTGFTVDPTGMAGRLLLLLAAAFGGLLLNLTPCVLPVIPLKVMALSRSAGRPARCMMLGAVMAAGVVAFWIGLGAMIALVRGVTATSELFRYPLFTIGVGAVIAVMAIGMCGLFALRLPQFIYRIQPDHDTAAGSFGFCVMTAVLSTPCTAPFMGAAAAWAVGQHPALTMTTFAAIGVGMALPYMLLAAFPSWIARIPRAGAAGDLIKQLMGLLMLAAAAYFIGVGVTGLTVRPGDAPSLLYWWPVVACVAAAGAWLAWRGGRHRPILVGLGVVIALGSLQSGRQLTTPSEIPWKVYTPARYAAAMDAGKVVVLDFTAEWCLNCKALEKTVLDRPVVVEVLSAANVAPMKVDFTGDNPDGDALLTRFGRVAIPLLVVVGPDGGERFKSDSYTAGQVVKAVKAENQESGKSEN